MSYVGKITDTSGVTGLVGSTLYGTCATGASTAAKVGTLSDFDQLIPGVTIHLKMTNSNTASSPTLNVNSTGAKAIRRYGTTAPGNNATLSWVAGSVISFTYIEESSTGYWYMNDVSGIKTDTVGSASSGTSSSGSSISSPLSGTSLSEITGWTPNTPTVVTLGAALTASKVTLGTAKSIPNVTGNTEVTIPNVTAATDVSVPVISSNTSVTVASVKTNNDVVVTATISEGVLTFSTGKAVVTENKTATNTSLGTATTASKVTLGTALKASKVTLGTAISVPNVTGVTDVTIPNVTDVTAGTAASLGHTEHTLTYTGVTIPNITVSSKTVVVPV